MALRVHTLQIKSNQGLKDASVFFRYDRAKNVLGPKVHLTDNSALTLVTKEPLEHFLSVKGEKSIDGFIGNFPFGEIRNLSLGRLHGFVEGIFRGNVKVDGIVTVDNSIVHGNNFISGSVPMGLYPEQAEGQQTFTSISHSTIFPGNAIWSASIMFSEIDGRTGFSGMSEADNFSRVVNSIIFASKIQSRVDMIGCAMFCNDLLGGDVEPSILIDKDISPKRGLGLSMC